VDKTWTKPRRNLDIDIDIDNDIDINIMYKYIIFFGVMSRDIIREAKHCVVGMGTGTWGIWTRTWEGGFGTGAKLLA
jgi:hypothetical protein